MLKFINYAHRGASAYAPENTISSFNLAIKLKSTGIELDLRQTKDKKIVIFHDDVIDNKSNGKGKISDYTYEELLKFDFGSWFNSDFKNEKIVLFEDFAELFLKKDLIFAIELKEMGFEKDVIDIIKKHGAENKVYITSFMFDILKNTRNIDHNIKIAWLIKDKISLENVNKLLEIDGNQICPNAKIIDREQIDFANSKGLEVRLWGVKDKETMYNCYNLDISGMTVNFPDKLNELLKNK